MAETPGIQLACAEEAGPVYSGPPSRLQATIRLVNPTAERLRLRSAGVQAEALLGVARAPLLEIPMAARLGPGEQMSFRSTIAIDPTTPPGTYPLSLTVGGKSVQATAHVTEVVDFRIEPDALTILAGKETSYTRDFVIENAGNVPLPLGERCEAPLLDSVDLITAMLVGLHDSPHADKDARLTAWLSEWSEVAAGTLVVTREPITLRPGQKISAAATFEVPPTLKPLRHYRASLQLYSATLNVDIYTTVKAGSGTESR